MRILIAGAVPDAQNQLQLILPRFTKSMTLSCKDRGGHCRLEGLMHSGGLLAGHAAAPVVGGSSAYSATSSFQLQAPLLHTTPTRPPAHSLLRQGRPGSQGVRPAPLLAT